MALCGHSLKLFCMIEFRQTDQAIQVGGILSQLFDNQSYWNCPSDFIEEEDGSIYITETQKTIARVHEVEHLFVSVCLYLYVMSVLLHPSVQDSVSPSEICNVHVY